ncbi:hypothetical protein GCM10007079_40470 [Nocardiopsis terrae]|uniref:Polyketide cyclase / dehydrase and lipid transport n=1 Tax=Nocardiopsis terrae TaxID=372655 RepID=A0ABR9HEH2_9ACTN|nr:hypothetical protein [Nocardiopsis terrae]MBE1457434.1 hypothetical protein [Nocardiopsis terrae]GHC92161.1 hypothetical protein GCM10007079_40470 [Nocardiopsis terrae]
MGTAFTLFLLFVTLAVVGGFALARWEKGVHRVPLSGQLSEPAEWLPQAMQAAARGGMIRWRPVIETVTDSNGDVIGYHGQLLSSDNDVISVDVPYFPAGDYPEHEPVEAEIQMEVFTVYGRFRFGAMPAVYIRRRWRKARRELKRHANQNIPV